MLSFSLLKLLPFAFLIVAAPLSSAQTIPAFPGAEGYGGYAKGGRGGDVYIVTNLNASGAGSFRNGIETVPSAGRTIVFAVSGHIHINGLRLVGSKVTIAGQTAPGDGVGLVDGTFRISGDDVVVRHMRFRHRKSGSGGDCVNLDSGSLNSVLDSISMMFSTDENFSSFNSPPENVTMQWSLNAWGLESHSCGGLWDQNRATAHHTLWAHNHTRNPKARPNELLEWINNVTFDWDIGFIMGDSATPANWKANVRNSYFLCPPGNIRTKALEKANLDRNGVPNFSLYLNNCRHDSNANGLLDGTDKGYTIASGSYTTLASPVANTGAIPVTMDDPVVAFKKVVSKAGALRLDIDPAKPLRDEVDTRLINNLVTQTANHITRESDLAGVSNGGIGTLNSTAAPVDTDKDGMPDFYETALGWNPAVQDHNTVLANSGGVVTGTTFLPPLTPVGSAALEKYTRLEEYLHYLAIPHGTVAKNLAGSPTSVQVDLRKFTSGFSSSPTFAIVAGSVANGGVTLSGTGNAIATFTPTEGVTGRARFDFTVTDSAAHTWTQTCAIVITNSGLPRDLLWKGTGNVWDNAALNWLRPATGASVAFSSPDRVTFDQSGLTQATIAVSGSQAPGTVEVNAASDYAFAVGGSINSLGTLTKRGAGALTLANVHAYAVGTALEEGTIKVMAGGNLTGGAVSMLDGTTFANLSPNSITVGAPFNVPAGHAATIKTGTRLNLTGALTGAGTLNYNVETTINRADLSNATGAFAGRLNFTSSGAGGAGVRLFFNGGAFNGFDNAHVDLANSVSLQPQTNSAPGNTLNIGALSGGSTAANLSGGTAGAVAYIVGASGADTTFAGSITGNLTFTKTGAGALTLSGTSSYTGATAVNDGELIVNGTLGATAVTIAGGAKLRGAGLINGAVTMQAGSQLSPGAASGQVGTLSLGSAGLSLSGMTLSMQLSSSPAGANDRVQMSSGMLALAGALDCNFSLTDGTLGEGTYDLVFGATNSTATGVTLTHNLPVSARQSFGLNASAAGANPSKIWLAVVGNPATLTWTGATSANWDTTTANNWTGATPNTFGTNDAVVLDDTATATTITPVGTVTPRSTLVNNSTKALTLGGGLGGGTLTKNGTNTLTLAGANSHAGTVLNAGTIALANDTANASALSSGTVALNGGVLSMYGDDSSYNSFTAALVVPSGATARINADPRVDLYGTLSGAGTLNFYVPWVRTTLYANWSAFAGTINVLADADGGDFRIGTDYSPAGYPLATIALTSNVWFYDAGNLAQGAGTTIEIGALSGPSNSHLRGGSIGGRALTYRIGGKNTDATFSGDIAEQNSATTTVLVKTGTGIWTLGGPCTHRGTTTVEAGTLRFTGTGSLTNDAPVNVWSGATLRLEGGAISADSVNIDAGGTFTTTGGSVTGELNNNGTMTVTGGTFTVTGDVVNTGTLRVTSLASLNASGAFVNDGILDLLTAGSGVPANLENNGIVIDSSSLGMIAVAKTGNTVTLSAMTYSGHVYQMQRADSLIAPIWANVGTAKAGNDAVQAFIDAAATGNGRFYRIAVAP